MAVRTEKTMVNGVALTTSMATYYTVSTSSGIKTATIKDITVCNTDTSVPRTFTLNVIVSGETSQVKNTQYNQVTLQPNETKTFGRSRVMNPGGFVQASASIANAIALSIDGWETT